MDLEADMTLAGRLVARDEDALREVMETYGGMVFGMANRIVTIRTSPRR